MEQNVQKITPIGVYIGLLGLATLVFGLADIFVWAGVSPGFQVGICAITGDDFFRWAWGGFIMVCAGIFMLAGCSQVVALQQAAKVVLGGALLWLIAGTDLFARLCAAIPADASSPAFFNSLSGFLGAFAPPYTPAVLLLPFTLGILYLIRMQGAGDS
ncbi:hypothetical protein L1S32_08875 [Methanogenium sp. S4BF]|uniref:hypothetical protein n=1 Tax=Methanogenium sp. S4BF TaxID=1789226 RepID=UPI002416281D|nr:hypothetical protein [Methanogenium sp. S4BF]WFN33954.1 hypothetical protein L1S32_08875 [Methanogenium sp. S4BF]